MTCCSICISGQRSWRRRSPLQLWVPPTGHHLIWFAVIGVLGLSGHYLIASAYKHVRAAILAPLEYTAMVWAVLIGYVFFSEVPTLATFVCGALILAGALVTSRR